MANMEDVLDLYAEPYDPQRPVVCFDETSTQLLAETRPALPPRPGLPLRQDYEYRREGTRNLFLACEPLAGWREVAVTERRTRTHAGWWMETPVLRVVTSPIAVRCGRGPADWLEFHYTDGRSGDRVPGSNLPGEEALRPSPG